MGLRSAGDFYISEHLKVRKHRGGSGERDGPAPRQGKAASKRLASRRVCGPPRTVNAGGGNGGGCPLLPTDRRADWELARLGVTGCRRGAGSAETPGPERCVPRPLGRAPREVNYATVSCSWGLSGPPFYFPLLKPAENRRRFIICPNCVINVLCHNGTIQIPQLIKYLRQTFKPDLRGEHMTVESSVSTPGAHTAWRLPVINSHMLSGAGNAKPKITVTLSPRHVFLLR